MHDPVSITRASIASRQSFADESPQRTRGIVPFNFVETVAIGSDLIVIVCASVITGVAYHLVFFDQIGPVGSFLAVGLLTYLNFSAILAARAAYRPQNLANFAKQVRQTTATWILVFGVLTAAAFSLKVGEQYSRGAIMMFCAAGLGAIIGWRYLIARFIANALSGGTFAEQKIVVLAERGQLIGSDIVQDLRRCGYRPVRMVEFAPGLPASVADQSRFFDQVNEIIEFSRQETIGGVFLLVSWDDRESIERLMDMLRVLSVPIYLLPDRNVAHFLGSRFVNIGTVWTTELKRAPLTASERILKRSVDVLLASIVLVGLSPLMVTVAALIKLQNGGPVLFRQTRNGFSGHPFKMYKFRTMSVLEDGPVIRQATKNDPRVTRLGRLLRRANLDELPQLWNVIVGDMSLVGPRPHAAAHNSEYEKLLANYAYRYHVRPGLTGWAQINGLRGETQTIDGMAQRVEFDLWYINNWSLWLDFKILLRTLVLGLQASAY